MEDFKTFKKKEVCFTCAHYNSARVNKIGFYCNRGLSNYQRADFHCGQYREGIKNDKQLQADYDVLEKKCR